MQYSHSRLEAYENCPRRYKFAYIDKLRTGQRSIEAFMGSACHLALEKLYEWVANKKDASFERVLGVYEEYWKTEFDDTVFVVRPDMTAEDYRAIGRDCVRRYYDANVPFDADRTVANELKISFPVYPGGQKCEVVGFIDRLSILPDGTFRIHDYKTSSRLPTQDEVDRMRQLAVYQIGVLKNWPDAKDVELVWHYLRFGKAMRSHRSADQLESLKTGLENIIERIQNDKDFETKKTNLCDWCEFKPICPAWRHTLEIEKAPAAEREADDGFKLAQAFGALEARRKKLAAELRDIKAEEDDLKERVVAFAKKEGVSALQGDAGRVEVKIKHEMKVPTKTAHPQDHLALEEYLRRTDLWGAVSHLDPKALLEGYRTKSFPLDVMEKLGRFLKEHEVSTVRFKPRRDEPEE